jgi:hypothetical protein
MFLLFGQALPLSKSPHIHTLTFVFHSPKTKKMAAYALLMGCNYFGDLRINNLEGCENDVRRITDIALDKGYDVNILLGADMTRENVLKELRATIAKLKIGDTLLLQRSSHGTQVNFDFNNDEADQTDEAFITRFGDIVLDDEWSNELQKIPSGVFVFVIDDLCFAGGMSRSLTVANRAVRRADAMDWYRHNDRRIPKPDIRNMKATFLWFAACQENQTALDGSENGLFTEAILKCLPQSTTYRQLASRVIAFVKLHSEGTQTPKINLIGYPSKKDLFLNLKPFMPL